MADRSVKTGAPTGGVPQTRALPEGYVVKGGKNPALSQIVERPPPPQPIKVRPQGNQGDGR